jgi:hypothetical protein
MLAATTPARRQAANRAEPTDGDHVTGAKQGSAKFLGAEVCRDLVGPRVPR